MGPILFNIFLNDLLYVDMNCDIASYAENNHLFYANCCANIWRVFFKMELEKLLLG